MTISMCVDFIYERAQEAGGEAGGLEHDVDASAWHGSGRQA
jgi:hypothetical protein